MSEGVRLICVGEPGVTSKEMLVGPMPAMLACTSTVPAVPSEVQVVCALPWLSVLLVGEERVPPPDSIDHDTVTPLAAPPPSAATCTERILEPAAGTGASEPTATVTWVGVGVWMGSLSHPDMNIGRRRSAKPAMKRRAVRGRDVIRFLWDARGLWLPCIRVQNLRHR
jgi:hypothetical protein